MGTTNVPRFYDIADIINEVLCPVARYMFWLLMFAALGMILFAAYTYLTARGDTDKVITANKTITFAAIAVILALVSFSFPMIIGTTIGASGGGLNPCPGNF